jgi:hypothetical protein
MRVNFGQYFVAKNAPNAEIISPNLVTMPCTLCPVKKLKELQQNTGKIFFYIGPMANKAWTSDTMHLFRTFRCFVKSQNKRLLLFSLRSLLLGLPSVFPMHKFSDLAHTAVLRARAEGQRTFKVTFFYLD